MDIFAELTGRFSMMLAANPWDAALRVFKRAAARKPDHWLIAARACEAMGGSVEQAVPAVLAIGCAHVSILLVDDMLDEDPRGDYHHLGMPVVSDLACFFQGMAFHAVSQCVLEPTLQLAALREFNDMFVSTAFGQFLDMQAAATELGYWQVVAAKSSPFFGTAFHLGGLAGGASVNLAGQLKELGCLYGEMIQIHDDMHDSMETPPNPDWVQGRPALPILFASIVQHPERSRFLELKEDILQPKALSEAQEILIRCGAISYCADQLIDRYESARKLLMNIPISNQQPISSLFEEAIAPVYQLLRASEIKS